MGIADMGVKAQTSGPAHDASVPRFLLDFSRDQASGDALWFLVQCYAKEMFGRPPAPVGFDLCA